MFSLYKCETGSKIVVICHTHVRVFLLTSGCHTYVTVNRVRCGGPITNTDFCAVLLGQPEEIALCALSTHYSLAAASFNPGIYTPLLPYAYSPAELLLLHSVFLCRTHSTHGCSALVVYAAKHTRQCNFQVRTDITVNCYGICIIASDRTDYYYSLLSPPSSHE